MNPGAREEPLPLIDPAPPIVPVQRLGAFVEVLLCSGFPSQLFVMSVLAGFGMVARTADGRFSPAFVFTLSMVDAVIVIALVFMFLRAHHESPRAVLLGSRPVLREAIVGVLLVPAVFMLVVALLTVVLAFVPQLHNVPHNPLEDMLQNRLDALIFGIVVMIAGGLREEIQRGFILHRFETHLGGGMVGLVLYSGLFGLGHVEQGRDAALATAVLGMVWGALYLARRSIVASMVSHAGFNLAQLLKYVAFR